MTRIRIEQELVSNVLFATITDDLIEKLTRSLPKIKSTSSKGSLVINALKNEVKLQKITENRSNQAKLSWKSLNSKEKIKPHK